MDAYALAWRLGDDGARTKVVEKMRAFSTSYPELAITGESIERSLTSRARASANAENGVIIDRRIRARLEAHMGREACVSISRRMGSSYVDFRRLRVGA